MELAESRKIQAAISSIPLRFIEATFLLKIDLKLIWCENSKTHCQSINIHGQLPTQLPPGGRWKAIKSNFSRGLAKSGIPVEKRQDGSAFVWQRRYWEHTIRNNDDLNRHIDYIHINPVKRVADWPYSSFHRYVRQGLLPLDWASDMLSNSTWGEPDFDD